MTDSAREKCCWGCSQATLMMAALVTISSLSLWSTPVTPAPHRPLDKHTNIYHLPRTVFEYAEYDYANISIVKVRRVFRYSFLPNHKPIVQRIFNISLVRLVAAKYVRTVLAVTIAAIDDNKGDTGGGDDAGM